MDSIISFAENDIHEKDLPPFYLLHLYKNYKRD